jgi:hypothetical protein
LNLIVLEVMKDLLFNIYTTCLYGRALGDKRNSAKYSYCTEQKFEISDL